MALWSEVNYSSTQERRRIDAEYYQPYFLAIQNRLEQQRERGDAQYLSELASVGYGYMPMQDYVEKEEGEPLLRVTNLKGNLFVDDSDLRYVPFGLSIPDSKRLKAFDTIVVQCGDTTGKIGYAEQEHDGMLFPSFCLRVRPNELANADLIALFLDSEIGQAQIRQRLTIATVRPNTTKPDIESLIVPTRLFEDAQLTIKAMMAKRKQSQHLYAEAEALLLSELRLDTLDLSHQLCYEANYSEARNAERLDAQHFQPMFRRLLDNLQMLGGNRTRTLRQIAPDIRRGTQPTYSPEGAIVVVNSQHLGATLLDVDATEHAEQSFWNLNAKSRLEYGDVLVYATGAYVGRTNAWLETVPGVASNHVTIIRPQDPECNPIYLSVFMNSPFGLMQTDQWACGSAQREIYPKDLNRFHVCLPPMSVQDAIADGVLAAHTARQEAKALLETAKRRVETLITGNTAP